MQDLNQLSLMELSCALPINDAVTRLLAIAAEEDLGPGGRPGDVTTQCCIPPSRWADGLIVAREAGVVSGVNFLGQVMIILAADCQLTFHAQDGERVRAGQRIAVLTGPMYQVLRAERTMLNLVGRMSGIATRTAEFVKAIEGVKGVKLLDTRKTTPGWRALEKYAVRCGGGHCHRIGLHDAVLFKDNHIFGVPPRDLPGWVRDATERARQMAEIEGTGLRFVELEVDSLEQLEPVLEAGGCGVDIILLDNMDCATMRRAIEMRKKYNVAVEFEASGGVNLQTIRAIAETGVERISVGGLTHHAVSMDVAMDIQDAERPAGWGEGSGDEDEQGGEES